MSYYSSTILNNFPPPVAYWRCDESAGTTAFDFTANSYNATLSGSITYLYPGAIVGDSDTALGFDAAGTLTLPFALVQKMATWSGLTFFFCIKQNEGWQYVAFTCDAATDTITPYLNADPYLGGVGDLVSLSPDLSSLGVGSAGDLDEVILFGSILTATQIRTLTLAAMAGPVSTAGSITRYKEQVVRVFGSDNSFIDVWRDAPLLAGFKESINSATTPLRVTLPRKFDNFDEAGITGNLGTIAQGNIVQYWLYGPGLSETGLLRYQGVIDRYEPQILESGEESLVVTLTPQNSVVGDNGISGVQQFGSPNQSGTYTDPINMFNYWFQNNDPLTPGRPYVYPLTLDPTNPTSSGGTSQYTFTQQNMLSIFNTDIQLLPANWYWRPNPDNTVTLNVAPTNAQLQFILGRHIVAPTYSKDWTQLKNVIQVLGATLNVSLTTALTNGTPYTSLAVSHLPIALPAGQPIVINNTTQGTTTQAVTTSGSVSSGATSIPVTSFTANSNYAVGVPIGIPISAVKQGSDLAAFGKRFYQYSDTRITDVATASSLAQYFLNTLDLTTYRFKLRIVDYRGDNQTGLGFDIETIKPGMTAQIINPTGAGQSNIPLWDTAVWDVDSWDGSPGEALDQVIIIQALTYNWDSIDIECASLAPSQDRRLIALANQFLLSQTAYY